MPTRTFRVSGEARDSMSQKPASGLRLELWLKSTSAEVPLGRTFSSQDGTFSLSVDAPDDRIPEILFRVSRDDTLLLSSTEIVRSSLATGEIEVRLTVRSESALLTVTGQVTRAGADSMPLANLVVAAFDKDMRSEEPLGQGTTDAEGHYAIRYTREKFSRAEKKSADLVVRVMSAAGLPLAESPVFFNAPDAATVDLVIETQGSRGPSEYERYVSDLTPVMQDVLFADLTEPDIRFLSGETSIAALHIAYLAVAARDARETSVPAEAFYGMFRKGLPSRLSALLVQSPQAQRRALEAALAENIIPETLQAQLDAILSRFRGLVAKQVFDVADERGKLPFVEVLDASLQPREKQVAFLDAYVRHAGRIEDFWNGLRQQPELAAPGIVEDFQFTLQLAALTGNNVPLLRGLKALRQNGTLAGARDLVKLDARAWTELINTSATSNGDGIPPGTPGANREEKVTNYVRGILGELEQAFPTDYVRLSVARHPAIDLGLAKQVLDQNPRLRLSEPLPLDADLNGLEDAQRERARDAMAALRREANLFPQVDYQRMVAETGGVPGAGPFRNPMRELLDRFLGNAPDFDLRTTHVDTFLKDNGERAFTGITETHHQEAVRSQLKRSQRVFQVAPRTEHMEALLGEGLDSAAAIARVPRKAFLRGLGRSLGGESRAAEYHARAEHIHGTMLMVFAGVHQRINDVMPKVIADA